MGILDGKPDSYVKFIRKKGNERSVALLADNLLRYSSISGSPVSFDDFKAGIITLGAVKNGETFISLPIVTESELESFNSLTGVERVDVVKKVKEFGLDPNDYESLDWFGIALKK